MNILSSLMLVAWLKKINYKVKPPIAGQSHGFFSKLEIYESLIAILVYRIQTSKRTL